MHTTITATVRSVVIGSDGLDRLRAYLYDHTKVVWAAKATTRLYAIIETTVTHTVDRDGIGAERDLDHEVRLLAEYQCRRLQSGLYFAIVAGTEDEAFHALAQQVRDRDVLGEIDHAYLNTAQYDSAEVIVR